MKTKKKTQIEQKICWATACALPMRLHVVFDLHTHILNNNNNRNEQTREEKKKSLPQVTNDVISNPFGFSRHYIWFSGISVEMDCTYILYAQT